MCLFFKWWDRCCLRCKVKSYLLTIIEKYRTYSMHGVLALSHRCECVNTKITSIIEERPSRNRRMKSARSRKSYQMFAAYLSPFVDDVSNAHEYLHKQSHSLYTIIHLIKGITSHFYILTKI